MKCRKLRKWLKIKGISEFFISSYTLFVVMDGIEPPTQGFSVLCSTN